MDMTHSNTSRNGKAGALAVLLALAITACSTPQSNLPQEPAQQLPPVSGTLLEAEVGELQSNALKALTTTEPVARTSGAAQISDPNASGGKAVALYRTGALVRFYVPSNLAAGKYTVRVRARGVYYQGWPVVALRKNGTQLSTNEVGTNYYNVNTFGDYNLIPGDRLDIVFTNDLSGGTTSTDRDVVVDYLVLDPVTTSEPAPAPAPSPTPDPTPTPTPTPTPAPSILSLINNARATARYCGSTYFPAAPALAWNSKLEAAALAHSQDMAKNNFFSHTGSDGSSAGTRITRAGYVWWTYGENIAAGYSTESAVMNGWLNSPGHCANIMNVKFKDVGVASATGGTYGIYWTMDLASSN